VSNLKGGFARLEVVDNGIGIPPDRISRIWEPYFSTKKSKQGLGLTIVKRIIEEHGGRIGYKRVDGRSVFSVEFII
jgi:signal transduction histidine kinase